MSAPSGGDAPAGVGIRLALAGISRLERQGLDRPAAAGYRRLWEILARQPSPIAERLHVAEALLRLALHTGDRDALGRALGAWETLGDCAGQELQARDAFLWLLRQAPSAEAAQALCASECRRAPAHGIAHYARGRLAAIAGDRDEAERAFDRAAHLGDERLAAAATSQAVALWEGALPVPGRVPEAELSPQARILMAQRLFRSAGRYARVRGLDLLLDLARTGHPPGPLVRAAAAHLDRVGPRMTSIERDRLEELVRRCATPELAALFARRVDLCEELGRVGGEERLALLAATLGGTVAELIRSLRARPAPVYPVPTDPRLALACEALRVADALRSGAPASFDRLLRLYEGAAPAAHGVATLWALLPCFVQRHGELGLARDRLRPILLGVLREGPMCSLDLALLARALDQQGEELLADAAACRAADEGDPSALIERTVRAAWSCADESPAQALRFLERARALETVLPAPCEAVRP